MTLSHTGLGPARTGGMDRPKECSVFSSPLAASGPSSPRCYDNSSNTIREPGDGQPETSLVEVRAYRRTPCPWLFAIRLIAVWRGAPTPGHPVRASRRALCAYGSSPYGSSRCGPGAPAPGHPVRAYRRALLAA